MIFIFCFLCCLNCLMGLFGDADEVTSVSVKEGHSVTLHMNETEIQNGTLIMWKFGPEETLIAKVRTANNTVSVYNDVYDGMFRDRLQVDVQTGSLTITNITTQHSGLYQMTISGKQKTSYTFNITVYSLTSVHIVVICCAVVGSLMIVLLIFCIRRIHTSISSTVTNNHSICKVTYQWDGYVVNVLIIVVEAVQGGEEEISYADPTFYKRQTHQPRAEVEDEVMYSSVNNR
ncbi:uncharacterized protein LOC130429568 isoform X1 [Triplophysa dalaica]|uniref:uncharacterized protein LOC130429568 isoform X1 n=1 Tax=Triplophysa dalaica TaxID=1582913 RepID=UPI0024DF3C7C|nr:uncharacterized protein LOC130429568 isoform X1 [Triplophysa dalaica]